ncbi:MAG: HU family DNA-binding protein [Oscillospiraceae bacterium]|nr:HU family DNA-binding protein [Oscillospiraceae bacterium]
MDKKGLRNQIAEKTGIPPETVETVLDSFKEVVVELLTRGDQLHWGGFIRIWTILKCPVDKAGQLIYTDTKKSKIRYRRPDCNFVTSLGKDMKEVYYNTAVKGWENKPPLPPARQPNNQVDACMEIS